MGAISVLIGLCNTISNWFYEWYLLVLGWGGLLGNLADFFFQMTLLFNKVGWAFYDFYFWVDSINIAWSGIFSWETIKSLILSWLPGLEDALNWWGDWWHWIEQEVEDWWNSTKSTVQGWISIATEGLDALKVAWNNFWNITWPQWIDNLSELRLLWDNFWTVTFPNLVNFSWLGIWWDSQWLVIQQLIEDTIKVWFPFYDSVVEFITDPLEWLWTKVADWFLGPEV